VGRAATLALTQDPAGSVVAGGAATWTWTATNGSNADIEIGVVEVLFDPDDLRSATVGAPDGWSCETPDASPGGPFLCVAIGRLKAGDTATFTLRGTVATTDPALDVLGVFRYATASSSKDELRAGVRAPVVQPASVVLSAAMDATSPQPVPGGRVVMAVTAANDGPATAERVAYRFEEPSRMSLSSVTTPDGTTVPVTDLTATPTSARWACTRTGGAVTCTGPDLHPDTAHRFVVRATVSPSAAPGTTLRFDAQVSSPTPNADPATTSATLEMTVVAASGSTATGSGTGTLPATGAPALVPRLVVAVALLLGGLAAAGVGSRARGRSLPATTRTPRGSA
jgi:hypothetical protein